MPRKRKRPTLKAPLGAEGRKALAEQVERINARGEAARAKQAASTGKAAGKAPAKRAVRSALNSPDLISRQIAQGEARVQRLMRAGAYEEADRVGYHLGDLRRKLRSAERVVRKAEKRRAMQDRFRVLVSRSRILTDWHVAVADRWLEVMTQAADGVMERAVQAEDVAEDAGETGEADGLADGGRDPVTGKRLKPSLDGPAIFLRGRSVVDRWGHAVPVFDALGRKRKAPPTFDPKAVKAAKRAPREGVQAVALGKRAEADRLQDAFDVALYRCDYPDWCGAVARRVILRNEGLEGAMQALGVTVDSRMRSMASTAMAAGLSGVAKALGMAVDK
ncbi:hypothetical protein [Hyphomonas pacifica]|uniref:Uncharacterized protein n=1 Tax=Hyphomonas pacifica TaxID=1280941 RepID=A0A8B2PQP0_9PROT|nr:hypothetical protein [Hyphomonas pacifica]RAN30646.1 hypothetical protein HY3_05710 [Hyphomonas pacifica]